MAKLSIRKGGITFYPEEKYQYGNWKLPEGDLLKLADHFNLTKIVKDTLAAEYVRKLQERQQEGTKS